MYFDFCDSRQELLATLMEIDRTHTEKSIHASTLNHIAATRVLHHQNQLAKSIGLFGEVWYFSTKMTPHRSSRVRCPSRRLPPIPVAGRFPTGSKSRGVPHVTATAALRQQNDSVTVRIGNKRIPLQPGDEGRLQIDPSAPRDGALTTIVTVEARLRQAQMVGQMRSLEEPKVRVARATPAGCAVSVRRRRSVRKGDALASIAPS